MTECFDSPMADLLYDPSQTKGRIPPRHLEGEWGDQSNGMVEDVFHHLFVLGEPATEDLEIVVTVNGV